MRGRRRGQGDLKRGRARGAYKNESPVVEPIAVRQFLAAGCAVSPLFSVAHAMSSSGPYREAGFPPRGIFPYLIALPVGASLETLTRLRRSPEDPEHRR